MWNDTAGGLASRLVVPEVSAALAAAQRAGRLDRTGHDAAQREWRKYLPAIDFVELTAEVAERAAALAVEHGLHGAVHLATAVAVRSPALVFVTCDRRLATAALVKGFDVVPASS